MDSSYHFKFKCPSCGVVGDQPAEANEVTCQACRQLFMLSGHYCPDCSEYSEKNQVSCTNCGEILMRSCPRCGRENWSGRLNCHYCGQSLDFFTTVAGRHSPTATADRLQAQMQQAKTIRAIDDVASGKRMEELNLIEEVRKSQIREQENKRKQRDRQLLIAAAVGLLLFILVIVIFSLLI
ncbi:MAG: hypothetical protein BMS9Abin02_1064 [Anaerolineae bacterium]|nr:MAG: hypothetical protein BMS9Abin02_1064 [Anaerolineae bacterium]